MKSRVQRNHDLYQNITSSNEEKIESNDLSTYANHLNELDNRFERMTTLNQENHDPVHAKSSTTETFNVYDTFENEYLKDFLEEVKEYNVKKGYRSTEDTQANILSAFGVKPPVEKTASLESLVDSIEKNHDIVESINKINESYPLPSVDLEPLTSKPETIELERPRHFDSTELLIKQGINPEAKWKTGELETMVEEVLATAKIEVSNPEITPDVDDDANSLELPTFDKVLADKDLFSEGVNAAKTSDSKNLKDSQTLQLKMDLQEKDLETINKSMVHTNRVLNAVIAIVLLCFLLVVAFIVKMFWFS